MENTDYQIIPLDLMGAYLDACQKFRDNEFGADVTIPLSLTKQHRAAKTDFYRAYGSFAEDEPVIKAIIQCFLISENEYELMIRGARDERELKPWTPADGPAVLWTASVLSTVTGGAARVMEAMIGDIEASPYLNNIKTVAAFVTGAKGYLFADACGLKPRPEKYNDELPFFERSFHPSLLTNASELLSRAWNLSAIRDTVQKLAAEDRGIITLRDGRYKF